MLHFFRRFGASLGATTIIPTVTYPASLVTAVMMLAAKARGQRNDRQQELWEEIQSEWRKIRVEILR